jgi:SAM-dependent methyltransferase
MRFILYQFYRGNNFQCVICGKQLRRFIESDNGDKLCPSCGSISRDRRLYFLLLTSFLRDDMSVLDFSPSRCLYRVLKANTKMNYTSTDLSKDFLSDFQYNITNLDVKDHSFDLVICYHILEHIHDDLKAIKELYRVTKTGGHCIVQTPFKEGSIFEDSLIVTDELRLKYFGQKDHVRIYSVVGLKERLSECGFQVIIQHFNELSDNRYGFKTEEDILICAK